MFTNLLPLFTTAALLIAGNTICSEHTANMESAPATVELAAPSAVTARLFITNVGNGYYLVVVDGQATAANASVGVRVYGDDSWFDDLLFSMGVGTARTDGAGRFNLNKTVHRSVLDEDWEGRDEIYAIADVSGAGSIRTNTIAQSF